MRLATIPYSCDYLLDSRGQDGESGIEKLIRPHSIVTRVTDQTDDCWTGHYGIDTIFISHGT